MENEFLVFISKKFSKLLNKKKKLSFKEMNDKLTKIMLREFEKEETPNIFDIINGLINLDSASKENIVQSILVSNFLLKIAKIEESKMNKTLFLPLLQSYVYFKVNQDMDLEFKLIFCSFLIDISKKTRELIPEIYQLFHQMLDELIFIQKEINEGFEMKGTDSYKDCLDLLGKETKLNIIDRFCSSLNFLIKLIEINYTIASRDINFDILHQEIIEKLKKIKLRLKSNQVLVENVIEKLCQTSNESELKPELEILIEKAIFKIKQLTPRIDYEKKIDRTLDIKKNIKKLKNEVILFKLLII